MENQESLSPQEATKNFETTLAKIKRYVTYRTKEQEMLAAKDEGRDVLPEEGMVWGKPKPELVVANGEMKIPSNEEMKGDFKKLAMSIDTLKEVASPSTIWLPARMVIEKYVASQVAPRDVEERYQVLKPVLDLFEKNFDTLKENNFMNLSVEDWISGTDHELADLMRKMKKNAAQ